MKVIEARGVGVKRGNAMLLHDINLAVEDHERWVVLGPNGAGKTTLLQLCAARIHPTVGTMTVLGATLGHSDLFELRPRIGLSSAALAERLDDGTTVIEAVVTAAWGVLGVPGRERYDELDLDRARGLLDQLGVGDLTDRLYRTLSEGERKRVQLARSLMSNPELLLLDEPSAGLDLGGREALLARLTRVIADPGAPTTILVTHHVEEIPVGISHALLLRDGAVVAGGPVAETLTAENLTHTFGLPIELSSDGGRYAAKAVL